MERSLEYAGELAGLGFVHDRRGDWLGRKILGREIGANRVYQRARSWFGSWRNWRPCDNRVPIGDGRNGDRLK